MNRKEFLAQLGTGGLLLAAIQCTQSCTHKENMDQSSTTDFYIDLSKPEYAALKTPGSFVFVKEIIVAFTIHQTFIAASARCTHEGSLLAYYPSDILFCGKHGASFATDGSVLQGPAQVSLKMYKTELSGNLLRIYA